MTFPAANAIYRARDLRQLSGGAGDPARSSMRGLLLPFDLALRVENRGGSRKILRSPEAAAMMMRSLFVSMQELNKGRAPVPTCRETSIKRVGIIGAGLHGARGVGYVTALAGIDVVLIDRDPGGGRPRQGAFRKADRRSDQPRTRHPLRTAMPSSRAITATADYGALQDCDPRHRSRVSRTAR